MKLVIYDTLCLRSAPFQRVLLRLTPLRLQLQLRSAFVAVSVPPHRPSSLQRKTSSCRQTCLAGLDETYYFTIDRQIDSVYELYCLFDYFSYCHIIPPGASMMVLATRSLNPAFDSMKYQMLSLSIIKYHLCAYLFTQICLPIYLYLSAYLSIYLSTTYLS